MDIDGGPQSGNCRVAYLKAQPSTVITANEWQFAYTVKILRSDSDGVRPSHRGIFADTAPGGAARESFVCRLRSGSPSEKSRTERNLTWPEGDTLGRGF